MHPDDEAAYVDFVTDRARPLRRTAYLMCRDWALAEDLVQTTFVKLYLHWHRIRRTETFDAYVRRTLVRTWLDETRRPWRRREIRAERVVEPGADDTYAEDDVRLREALSAVPPRQRAVLVLRYVEDLSVEETAQALDCSTGTVKSQTARGLANLRRALADAGLEEADLTGGTP